jgi:hypothetical protein
VSLEATVPLVDSYRAGTKIDVLSAGSNSGAAYHSFQINNAPVAFTGGRGWNIALFDAVTCNLLNVTTYDTWANPGDFDRIVNLLESVNSQTIVAMAVNDEGQRGLTSKAREYFLFILKNLQLQSNKVHWRLFLH